MKTDVTMISLSPEEHKTRIHVLARKKCERLTDSRKLFKEARNRLLDVNHWNEFIGKKSGSFILTDAAGNHITALAEAGNLIWFPSQTFKAKAKGEYECVRIESIESERDLDGEWEHCSITVRPAIIPNGKQQDVVSASPDSSSTFKVERFGRLVFAAEHRRNEIPARKTERLKDRLKNAVVTFAALIGFANLQWRQLVRGFLNVEIAAN